VHLYVERGSVRRVRRIAQDARSRRASRGFLQIYTESLSGLSVATRAGLPVTSPFQTVVDLRAHPEGGAHAAFLEANLLPRLREGP
ncbi:MAG TPA: hypothetical protein VM681_03695, partial [Candidatus Thermoplasmatota archaeon]|nr:hypothetical protein [Candidatus Thermoplasmatota archaeon]